MLPNRRDLFLVRNRDVGFVRWCSADLMGLNASPDKQDEVEGTIVMR